MGQYDDAKVYCRGDEWNVSYEQVSGDPARDYQQTTLRVFKVDHDAPNQWGGRGVVVDHPQFARVEFSSPLAARRFAFDQGLIHEYQPKANAR